MFFCNRAVRNHERYNYHTLLYWRDWRDESEKKNKRVKYTKSGGKYVGESWKVENRGFIDVGKTPEAAIWQNTVALPDSLPVTPSLLVVPPGSLCSLNRGSECGERGGEVTG